MRAKTVTVFLITFALFVGLLVWRVDNLFFGDKLNWSEAGERAQMSVVISSLEGQIQNLKDLFNVSYPKVVSDGKDFSAHQPYSVFQAMMTATPISSTEGKDWKLSNIFYQAKSSVRNWASAYIGLALRSVKPSDIRPDSVNLYSLMDPERRPYLLMLVHNSNVTPEWSVGLLGPEVFQKLMDRQKGQLSQVYLVNLQAQALGHTVPEYVGSLLSEDPLVADLINSGSSSGGGFFKNLKGQEIQGMYEQVGSTNVFAVISTPMQELLKNRDQIRWQLILLGLGIAFVGAALFAFTDGAEAKKGSKSMAGPAAPKGPHSISTANLPVAKLADGVADRSAVSASAKIAASISHELKNPLTSILGHVQLAKTHTADAKALEHLVRLENEARQAREIVQKLLIFAGEDKHKMEKSSLAVAVQKALKAVEGRALSKGVKIIKDLQTVPDFVFAPELVSRAVENVLTNAIEAMERVSKKELLVKLKGDNEHIVLTVTDSGEGIEAPQLEKVFDPFFTTRATSGHVGLGLSTTLGIVKEAHGEINIRSEKGQGTTVEMRFAPEGASQAVASAPISVAAKSPTPAVAETASSPTITMTATAPISAASSLEKPAISSLLVDQSIEKLIDEDPLEDKKLAAEEAKNLPAPPAEEFEPTLVLESDETTSAMSKVSPSVEAKAPLPSATPQLIDVPAFAPQAAAPAAATPIPAPAPPAEKTVASAPAAASSAVPVAPAVAAPAVAGLDEKQFSSKIDKPKLDLKKKSSKLDEVQVSIRRPGERV